MAPVLPAPSSAPEQIPLTLVGTIVGGANSIAICFNPSTRDVVRLRIGENFQGWVLRAVHGREAAFEKAALRANLALPSPEDQQASALPMMVSQPTPLFSGSGSAAGSGTWRDGDGQLIAAPPAAQSRSPTPILGVAPPAGPQSRPADSTWRDGDGQLIAPPPKGL